MAAAHTAGTDGRGGGPAHVRRVDRLAGAGAGRGCGKQEKEASRRGRRGWTGPSGHPSPPSLLVQPQAADGSDQYAAKLGHTVVVFSHTASKRADALSFGAAAFHSTASLPVSPRALCADAPLDMLLLTVPLLPENLLAYLPLLAPRATLVPLTIAPPPADIAIPQMAMVMSGLRIQGSLVAPRESIRACLAFAAEHGVRPRVQEWPMSRLGIGEAFKALQDGEMRYRGVLKVEEADRYAE